jgi:hypothetical protein
MGYRLPATSPIAVQATTTVTRKLEDVSGDDVAGFHVWLSALSESILSGGIPSLNHDAITWHRGTQRMLRAGGQRDSGVSNYSE